MPGAIGTISTFTSWSGEFQAPTPAVEVYSRAGTAGVGIMVSAAHGRALQVITTLKGTLAECQAHRDACDAVVGTVASATDAYSRTYAHTAIVSASPTIIPARGLGGTATHLCRCEWTLIPEA